MRSHWFHLHCSSAYVFTSQQPIRRQWPTVRLTEQLISTCSKWMNRPDSLFWYFKIAQTCKLDWTPINIIANPNSLHNAPQSKTPLFVFILLGSTDSFLFSLRPKLDIYRPTGLNTNYFYLNTGQETFPNGVVSNYLYIHKHLNSTNCTT